VRTTVLLVLLLALFVILVLKHVVVIFSVVCAWRGIFGCESENACILQQSTVCTETLVVLCVVDSIDNCCAHSENFCFRTGGTHDDVLAQFVCIFDSTKRSICEIINTELKPFYERGRVQKHEKRTFFGFQKHEMVGH